MPRTLAMLRRRRLGFGGPALRPILGGGPAGFGAGARMVGPFGEIRKPRRWNETLGGVAKLPGDLMAYDDNVYFGMGSNIHAAAATGQVLSQQINRPLILRDLVIADAGVRGRVTNITAAGDTLHQGGTCPFEVFAFGNLSRPDFGIPVYTGLIAITYNVDAAATVEAAFEID